MSLASPMPDRPHDEPPRTSLQLDTGKETTVRKDPLDSGSFRQTPEPFPTFLRSYPPAKRAEAWRALHAIVTSWERPNPKDDEEPISKEQEARIIRVLRGGDIHDQRMADLIAECSTQEGVSGSGQDPTRTKWFRYRCRKRMCFRCQMIRAEKIRRRLVPVIRDSWRRREKVRFLTLTQRSIQGETANPALRRMQRLFVRFRKHPEFVRHCKAWARFVEITCPEPGRWHAHIHMLFVGSWWSKHAISALLAELQGEEYGICDIRIARQASLDEAVKYPLKPLSLNNMSDEDLLDYARGSRGLRFVSTGGRWARLPKLPKDPNHWSCTYTELIDRAHEGNAWAVYALDHLHRDFPMSVPQRLYKAELLPPEEEALPPPRQVSLDFRESRPETGYRGAWDWGAEAPANPPRDRGYWTRQHDWSAHP